MGVHALLKPLRRDRLGPESIREVVFGVEDGAVQNMALIAGMVGATLAGSVIVLAGSINAIAGVLSMSMGTYLSSQAERDAISANGSASRPGSGPRSPIRDAMVMAAAYAAGAVVPLVPFTLPFVSRTGAVIAAMGLTASGSASSKRSSVIRRDSGPVCSCWRWLRLPVPPVISSVSLLRPFSE